MRRKLTSILLVMALCLPLAASTSASGAVEPPAPEETVALVPEAPADPAEGKDVMIKCEGVVWEWSGPKCYGQLPPITDEEAEETPTDPAEGEETTIKSEGPVWIWDTSGSDLEWTEVETEDGTICRVADSSIPWKIASREDGTTWVWRNNWEIDAVREWTVIGNAADGHDHHFEGKLSRIWYEEEDGQHRMWAEYAADCTYECDAYGTLCEPVGDLQPHFWRQVAAENNNSQGDAQTYTCVCGATKTAADVPDPEEAIPPQVAAALENVPQRMNVVMDHDGVTRAYKEDGTLWFVADPSLTSASLADRDLEAYEESFQFIRQMMSEYLEVASEPYDLSADPVEGEEPVITNEGPVWEYGHVCWDDPPMTEDELKEAIADQIEREGELEPGKWHVLGWEYGHLCFDDPCQCPACGK